MITKALTDANLAYEAIDRWVESCEERVAAFLSGSPELRHDIAQAFAAIPLTPGQEANWIRCDLVVPADMPPGNRTTVEGWAVTVDAVSSCWTPDGDPVIVQIVEPEQLSVWDTLNDLLDELNADFPPEAHAHSMNLFTEVSLAVSHHADQAQLEFGSLGAARVEVAMSSGMADDYAEALL